MDYVDKIALVLCIILVGLGIGSGDWLAVFIGVVGGFVALSEVLKSKSS